MEEIYRTKYFFEILSSAPLYNRFIVDYVPACFLFPLFREQIELETKFIVGQMPNDCRIDTPA